jgi:hypothetical protein
MKRTNGAGSLRGGKTRLFPCRRNGVGHLNRRAYLPRDRLPKKCQRLFLKGKEQVAVFTCGDYDVVSSTDRELKKRRVSLPIIEQREEDDFYCHSISVNILDETEVKDFER